MPVRTTHVHQLHLSPEPAAAGAGRSAVARLLADPHWGDRRDDVLLATSELLTNAVLHGREPITVTIRLADATVRVEVSDGSPVSPTFSLLDPTAITGRGLVLVSRLVDRWGVEPTTSGKTVWFEMGLEREGGLQAGEVEALLASWADQLVTDPADEEVRVVLTDLDTDLHARAEAHVEGLLRELSLHVAARPDATGPTQVALRALEAAAGFEAVRTDIKGQLFAAVQAGERTLDIELKITRGDAELVRDFAAAMDDADRLSRQGQLLGLPAPANLSEARQRYLARILAQLGS